MRKHLVLLGILGLGVGLAGCEKQQAPAAQTGTTTAIPTASTSDKLYSVGTTASGTSGFQIAQHMMGKSCTGSDDTVCHLTVNRIRADETNPNHESVNLSTDKQDSLHISGEKPFTVEFVSDDNGPPPFYRPMGKPSKVFASGPARPEASGHKYHMVIRDEEGAVDPHIIIDRCMGHEGQGTC